MARGTIQYAASGKFASTGVDDNGDATTLTIDANENLGIGGVSPIGTHSTLTSVRVGGNAIINHTTASAASGSLDITQNANYDTDGSWEYIVTDEVSRYQQSGGEHILDGVPFRGNYAGIGMIYDEENDVFYSEQPYPSWILNETTWSWESPVPYPEVDSDPPVFYEWNETDQTWDVVE